MDAHVSRQKRCWVGETGCGCVELGDAGVCPVLDSLAGRVHKQIVRRVFLVAAGRSGIVNNDADLLRASGNAHIEVGAKAVSACYLDGPASVVAGVFCCVVKGIDSPTSIVAVRPVVVDADGACGNGLSGEGWQKA